MLAVTGIVTFIIGVWELFSSRSITQVIEILAVVIGGLGLITYSILKLMTGGLLDDE
jgi:hypothetical protein